MEYKYTILARQMDNSSKSFDLYLYLCSTEPTESVSKGNSNLDGEWTNLLAVTFEHTVPLRFVTASSR